MSDYLTLPKRALADIPLRLPPGKTEAEAIARAVELRQSLWRNLKHEDERLKHLEDYCTRLCCGDRASGKALATRAVWTP